MKTTIDIAKSLLEEAKDVSKVHKKTLRELVEEGLRLVILNYRVKQNKKIKIKPHIVTGKESDVSWSNIQQVLNADEENRYKK